MDTSTRSASLSPRLLAAAPHRPLFLIGVLNVLVAMAWWAAWLAALRWHWPILPRPAIPAGWAHAILMPYLVLAPFMFGFLLTVFPRWCGQPDLGPRHYLPVALGLFAGQALTLIGLWGHPALLHAGAVFVLLGWGSGMVSLLRVLWHEPGRTWHAVSAWLGMALGAFGFALYAFWLHAPERVMLPFTAIKLGLIGFALPVYVAVCHRMIPFFASRVLPDYRVWRPMPLLALCWLLIGTHLWLELSHAYDWLWLADLPLTVLFGWMLWHWWPRRRMPGLLMVLLVGFAWLPTAFALYSAQSLWLLVSDQFALGRAPSHALAVGFFGSLLVAMVTRVSQGHSGRPLRMTTTAWFAFAVVQLAAWLRVIGEMAADALAWQAVAAFAWLLAFAPWVLRSAWLYLAPRADGGQG